MPEPVLPGDVLTELHQRWNEGVTDAAALHAELRERGWAGSEQTVRRYVRPFRQAPAAPGPAPAVPKTRQITRWLLTRPDHLQAGEQAQRVSPTSGTLRFRTWPHARCGRHPMSVAAGGGPGSPAG
jgi:hypothetical protein